MTSNEIVSLYICTGVFFIIRFFLNDASNFFVEVQGILKKKGSLILPFLLQTIDSSYKEFSGTVLI